MNDLRISPISILRKDQLQRVDISAHAVQVTVQTPSPASAGNKSTAPDFCPLLPPGWAGDWVA